MFPKLAAGAALFCAVACSSSALAGPEWVENGDAGSFILSAQRTQGQGQLSSIAGTLGGAGLTFGIIDFEDMYIINITDPGVFTMKIENADFDAQLFVFNITLPGEAFGLLANDNSGGGPNPALASFATDKSSAEINLPGTYAIAVSGAGRNPLSVGGLIFSFQSDEEISGPDGLGGINPLSDWNGQGQTGSYLITFEGAAPVDAPAPGALALLGLAALFSRPRRRR